MSENKAADMERYGVACLMFHPALWQAGADRIVRKLMKNGSLQKRPAEGKPTAWTAGVGRGEGMRGCIQRKCLPNLFAGCSPET